MTSEQSLLQEIIVMEGSFGTGAGKIVELKQNVFGIEWLAGIKENKPAAGNLVNCQVDPVASGQIYRLKAEVLTFHSFDNRQIVRIAVKHSEISQNKRHHTRLTLLGYFSTPGAARWRSFPPRDSPWNKGEVMDIGEGGARLLTNTYYDTGQLIECEIKEPVFTVAELVLAKVTSVNERPGKGYQLAMQFLNLSRKNTRRIKQMVEAAGRRMDNRKIYKK
ncbi:PilZ domain-containing protein [Alteribacillus sp. HJP-4]|uniref:PilZ domain-containing protein n=1 Tax=Alteribacillus sp. HJP-4 TaxID=2775394 RepID=UPI0035CD1EF3